jgi:hypothetical protein
VNKRQKSILAEAEEIIHGARHKSYGDVEVAFKRYATIWSEIIDTKVSPEQVCMCMIALKMCREKNKPSRDNRVDIAGYTALLDLLATGGKQGRKAPRG